MKFLPPDGFTAAGVVSRAEVTQSRFVRERDEGASPASAREAQAVPPGVIGAKRAGLRFEAKAQLVMAALLSNYLPGPWFRFWTHLDEHARVCQPDGICIFPSHVLIVEIKTQHTQRAWWQLRMLYQPVIERVYSKPAAILELVQTGDPLAAFPEPVKLLSSPESLDKYDPAFLLCFLDSVKPKETSDEVA